MKKPNRVLDTLFVIAIALVALACMAGIGRILSSLAPMFTILLVVMLTTRTFENRIATLMALGGIALYLAAWPVSWIMGSVEGSAVFLVGLIMWLIAVLNPRSTYFDFCRPISAR